MKMMTIMMGGTIMNPMSFTDYGMLRKKLFDKKIQWFPLFTEDGKNAGQIQIMSEFTPDKKWEEAALELER